MTDGSLKAVLSPVLRVLRDLGGKFVFTDDDGETFVIMSKSELVKIKQKEEQQQLVLPPAGAVEKAVREHVPVDLERDVIERINRDIALAHSEEEVATDDIGIQMDAIPAKTVRFESLKGDLPPELQE